MTTIIKKTGDNISVEEFLAIKAKDDRESVISDEVRKRLEKVIVARDARNNGMSRREVIEVISQLGDCTLKQADNYFTYASARGKFPLLKRGRKVVTAQKTTTSRTQVTVEQQYRWHLAVDFCWEQQKEMNLPFDDIKKKHPYFQSNLDE